MDQPFNVLLLTSKSWAGFNISPPLGLYNLKASIEANGHRCDIRDYDIDDEQQIKRDVSSGLYRLIGMSVTHVNMVADLNALLELSVIARRVQDTLIVVGGQEATLNYKQWLDSGVVDICFLGFADKSLAQFCNAMAKENAQFHNEQHLSIDVYAQLEDMDGVAYIDQRIKSNIVGAKNNVMYAPSERLTEKEFREIFYERGLSLDIPYHRYWDVVRERKINAYNNASFTIETVRLYTVSHCPRRCGFCSSQNFLPLSQGSNSTIIMLSAQEVFELVMHHHRLGARAFLFSDDDFPVGNSAGITRIHDFCNLVIDAKSSGKLSKDIRFFCQARVLDFLKRKRSGPKVVRWEMLKAMKKAGFDNVGLGIETFSERLMHMPSVNKVGVTLEDYHTLISALLRENITPQMFIIIGIPESTVEEVVSTVIAAAEYTLNGADTAAISSMRAYPGSPISLSGQYDLVTIPWTNPQTGKVIHISDLFAPQDKQIAKIIHQIDDQASREQASFRKLFGWSNDVILSKSLVAMTQFLAVARLLKQSAVADKLEVMILDGVTVGTEVTNKRVT